MIAKLNDVLAVDGAVGSFNVTDLEMALAILEAAEDFSSPVIIGIATRHWKQARADLLAPSLLRALERSRVQAALHLDHASPDQVDLIRQALDCGFNSVMIDGSRLPFGGNASVTSDVVMLAQKYGASVEGEIGAMTGIEGVTDGRHDESENLYTDPDEASRFAAETGIDALAVSIGTAHGLYKSAPVIKFDLISAIREKVSVPLVMHGATGISNEAVRETIRRGIKKINFFSGLVVKAVEAASLYLKKSEKPDYLELKKALYAGWKEVASEQIEVYSMKQQTG